MRRTSIAVLALAGSTMLASALLPTRAGSGARAAAGFRIVRFGGRVTAVWYPASARPAPYSYSTSFSGTVAFNAPATRWHGLRVPLVVFSHGDLGCGLQSLPFTEELAREGYIVAAPDHADAFLCHIIPGPSTAPRPQQPNFLKPETWDDRTFAVRRGDLEAVIDALLRDREFGPVIDPGRIGAAGHSLGGYTVVGMAGGWPTWVDPRIRAVLAFSPYVLPFEVRKTLAGIHLPLMYQGGTLDVGITPFLIRPGGAYWEANPPVYFVNLRRAGHFAWANCGPAHNTETCLEMHPNARLINEYGIAFFNHYLKHLPEPILEKSNPAVAAYKFRLPDP